MKIKLANFVLIFFLVLTVFKGYSADKWSFGQHNYALVMVAEKKRDDAMNWAAKNFGVEGLKNYNIKIYKWKNGWHGVALMVNTSSQKSLPKSTVNNFLAKLKKNKQVPKDSYITQDRKYTACYGYAKKTDGSYTWARCDRVSKKR